MLSYRNWKTINESLDIMPLGVTAVPSVGVIGSVYARDEEMLLAEMKKKMAKAKSKMRKKMGVGDDEGMSDEDDGEVVKPAAQKDVDPDADADAAEDSEDDGDKDMDKSKDMDKDAPKKPGEGDGDHEDEDGDDEGSAKEMMFMKKKMKKGCGKTMKKEEAEIRDDPWFQSIANMMGDPSSEKNWDGFTPLQPGEVGFAPQGRIGSF